jgi:drug/metabolite transporter (DMT)-like permease
MVKLIVILLIALCFETMGVITLKKGLVTLESPRDYSPLEITRLVGRGITNKNIVLGVFFEALFFIGLLMMMKMGEVSFVWPLTSLTFVFSTVAARFYLHEDVSLVRWAGVFCIMCGAGLITYSEKAKESQTAATAPAASSLERPGLQ